MTYLIDLQNDCQAHDPLPDDLLISWAQLPLKVLKEPAELTLRLVDTCEMQHLNFTYRQQNKVTNVLAFPSAIPKEIQLDPPLLGDVIICPEVIESERLAQNKSPEAHWAHIIIHGVLHLLGYDHLETHEAQQMQTLEIKLLNQLGFANPYKDDDIE